MTEAVALVAELRGAIGSGNLNPELQTRVERLLDDLHVLLDEGSATVEENEAMDAANAATAAENERISAAGADAPDTPENRAIDEANALTDAENAQIEATNANIT